MLFDWEVLYCEKFVRRYSVSRVHRFSDCLMINELYLIVLGISNVATLLKALSASEKGVSGLSRLILLRQSHYAGDKARKGHFCTSHKDLNCKADPGP